jgi:hypothetical protein
VRSRLPRLEQEFNKPGIPVYYISAATGEGVKELMLKALELVSQADKTPVGSKMEGEFKVFRPRPVSTRRAAKRGEEHGRD